MNSRETSHSSVHFFNLYEGVFEEMSHSDFDARQQIIRESAFLGVGENWHTQKRLHVLCKVDMHSYSTHRRSTQHLAKFILR